jgi:hypothetical protein
MRAGIGASGGRGVMHRVDSLLVLLMQLLVLLVLLMLLMLLILLMLLRRRIRAVSGPFASGL